jgi:hypothetical protein
MSIYIQFTMGAKARERAGPVAIQIPNAAEYGSIHFILKSMEPSPDEQWAES